MGLADTNRIRFKFALSWIFREVQTEYWVRRFRFAHSYIEVKDVKKWGASWMQITSRRSHRSTLSQINKKRKENYFGQRVREITSLMSLYFLSLTASDQYWIYCMVCREMIGVSILVCVTTAPSIPLPLFCSYWEPFFFTWYKLI